MKNQINFWFFLYLSRKIEYFYLIKLIEVIKIKKFYTARYEPIFMRSVVKPNILKPLLEYILEKEIVELEILNPNLVQDYFKVRGQRLGVLVKTKEDIINVEINSFSLLTLSFVLFISIQEFSSGFALVLNWYATSPDNVSWALPIKSTLCT